MLIDTKYGEVFVLTKCPTLGSTERFGFKTEIHEAYDSTESRFPLREYARQELRFNYQQAYKDMGDMFHILYARLRKLFGVPLLHLNKPIGNIENDDFIQIDTTLLKTDFHTGYALIYSNLNPKLVEIIGFGREVITQEEIRDPDTNEIIQPEIKEFQDGFLLKNKVIVNDGILIPLRICIINGDVSSTIGGHWSRQDITFDVLAEDCSFNSENYDQQYKGKDIYFKPLYSQNGTLDAVLSQQQNIVDSEVGGFHSSTRWDHPRYAKNLFTHMKDQNDLFVYRDFLFRRMGRLNEFWCPLFEKQLTVVGQTASTITVSNNQVIGANRKHLAININGVWSAHEITSISKVGNNTRITFEYPIVSNISSVYYLGLYRLDSDSIEFTYKGNDVSSSSVQMIEITP